jgi:excisionase family DNA binding protein
MSAIDRAMSPEEWAEVSEALQVLRRLAPELIDKAREARLAEQRFCNNDNCRRAFHSSSPLRTYCSRHCQAAQWQREYAREKRAAQRPEPAPRPAQPAPAGAYSPEDAARYLGIGRTTLYTLIKEGKVSAVKIGRRTVVPRSELDALLRMETTP